AQTLNATTIPSLQAFGNMVKAANLEGFAGTASFLAASLLPVGLALRGASFALQPFGGLAATARIAVVSLAASFVELAARVAILGPAGALEYLVLDLRAATAALGTT